MKPFRLYAFIGSFALGAGLFSIERFFLSVSIVLLIVGAALLFRCKVLLIVCVLGVVLGGARIELSQMGMSVQLLNHYLNKSVEVVGVVVREPSKRERSTRVVVRIERVDGERFESDGIHLVTSLGRYPEVYYGDQIQMTGRLALPEDFETENGRLFRYKKFLEKENILYTLHYPRHIILSSGGGNRVSRLLFGVKQKWIQSVTQNLSEPHASLLSGLVVGAKDSLGDVWEERFRKTGLIHIVVLSGYNVTIVAEAIMKTLSFFPRVVGLSFGALSIVLFAILTGGSATIVRASIMALIALLARATNRSSDGTHALILAAFGMVLHNPMIVAHDPSFQLSFTATLGLIHISPRIEKYLPFISPKFQLRELASATIGTQIAVLPLLIYMTGEVSLVSLPANLLVLPVIPLTMLAGFFTGAAGLAGHLLALPFAFVAHALLSYVLGVVALLEKVPFATMVVL